MTDNITPFPGAADLPENPIQLVTRHGFCNHDTLLVDEHTRTITCADPKCAASINAFDYLRSQAHRLQFAWANYRSVTVKANEMVDRVTVLKREEQRLRGIVKRLQEKAAAGGAIVQPAARNEDQN